MSHVSAIQVLPQSRRLPKMFIWLIYAVILVGLIAAIATLVIMPQQQLLSNEINKISGEMEGNENQLHVNLRQFELMDNNDHQMPMETIPQQNYLLPNCSILPGVNLEQIIAYQCFFEITIKNISWLVGSDKEISYWNDFGEYKVMNVKNGDIYSSIDIHAQNSFPWYDILMPQHRIAVLGNCTENLDSDNKECFFKVFLLSSTTEKGSKSLNHRLISKFSELINGQPGVYNYIDKDINMEHLFMSQKKEYTINLKNPTLLYPSNSCIIKFLEEYEFIWHSAGFFLKCIKSLSEICENYSLFWIEDFSFNPSNPQYYFSKFLIPTLFLIYPAMYTHSKKYRNNELNILNINRENDEEYLNFSGRDKRWKKCLELQKHQITNRNLTSTNYTNNSSRIYRMINQNPKVLTTGFPGLMEHLYNYEKQDATFLDARLKNEKSIFTKKRSLQHTSFQCIKIANSTWFLHTIIDREKVFNRSFLNLAISDMDTLASDMFTQKNTKVRLSQWIPYASERYRPLLPNDLYVIQILAVRSIGHDEALANFIAAPVSDFSQRLLYQLKIIYPPLKYRSQEIALCMTCSTHFQKDMIYSDKDDFTFNYQGNKPTCVFSDVLMSTNAQYYILNCRGPELPWTSIVSTHTNKVIRHVGGTERFRAFSKTVQTPITRQFMIRLKNDYWARVRVHLPPSWRQGSKGCTNKLRLLLRIADHQTDQLITSQYDMSLTTHLATLGHYAVIYADVRASKLQILDFKELEFRLREAMQMQDYETVVNHVLRDFQCIDVNAGVGVYGQGYGGHMALKLIAGHENKTDYKNYNEQEKNLFQCCVALKPFTHWYHYVYPFKKKTTTKIIDKIRKKVYEKQYLSQLARLLRNKHFTLIGSFPKHDKRREYTENLLQMFERQGFSFDYHVFEDSVTCGSKINLYEQLRNYFDRCFKISYNYKCI